MPGDLAGRPDRALAYTWTELRNFYIPYFGIHIFGPEGPRSALHGARGVDRTPFTGEKFAILFNIFQMPQVHMAFAVALGKCLHGDLEMAGESTSIFSCEIDVAIATTARATVAAALTLKPNSV